MSKPDKIVEEMKRLEARRIGLPLYLLSKEAEERWKNTAFQYIPYSLKLLAEKDKEIERLNLHHNNSCAECIRELR